MLIDAMCGAFRTCRVAVADLHHARQLVPSLEETYVT
jgi:hypothetical protein